MQPTEKIDHTRDTIPSGNDIVFQLAVIYGMRWAAERNHAATRTMSALHLFCSTVFVSVTTSTPAQFSVKKTKILLYATLFFFVYFICKLQEIKFGTFTPDQSDRTAVNNA